MIDHLSCTTNNKLGGGCAFSMATHLQILAVLQLLSALLCIRDEAEIAIVTLWSAFSGLLLFNQNANAEMRGEVMRVLVLRAFLGFLLSLVPFVAQITLAVGLFKDRRWARRLSLLLAMGALFVVPMVGLLQLTLLFWPNIKTI